MSISRLLRPVAVAAGLLLSVSPALAQENPGYFIPPSARPAPAPRPAPRPTHRSAPAVQPALPPQMSAPGPIAGPGAEEGPLMQLQLPPAPELPAMAKGTPPPAAVIGVIGIPEIMRASTAAQQIEKIIGERRESLQRDAQKEQLVWRDLQQSLANERGKLNAEQIRAKEKELQDRITSAQKTFRDRNRVIQEAGQYGLAQIERMLVSVIRQVSDSRGMNIVLHRAQVALNVNDFDITDQVAEQLNKVLPSVTMPPEGVSPPMAPVANAPQHGAPSATPASANPAAPANAPAGSGGSSPPAAQR